MRVALHSVLHPGSESGYVENHQRIPDDLAASFARVGIHEWTIWRSGRDLFHLVECDDFDAAMSALADDPANARWQAHIGRFVDGFVSAAGDGEPRPIERVWDLGEQRGSGA
ncbi:L-rhamnose mutarotase [Haloactinopolyspora alba]|uniref:L-rhamnose mutarotase n=1 Tax=Haloactinopolyspora alba TaxID=648780 RepID=A0A2P8EBJ4_9ACTN|nr:L-rhamnose mutarotase [Haloactinopolyspora alba]PSL06841.1 L-rhamnose mutarotase [Haloactinopolyspora alba]